MQDTILNRLGFDPGYLILGLMVILVFVLIYLASISMKMSRAWVSRAQLASSV